MTTTFSPSVFPSSYLTLVSVKEGGLDPVGPFVRKLTLSTLLSPKSGNDQGPLKDLSDFGPRRDQFFIRGPYIRYFVSSFPLE